MKTTLIKQEEKRELLHLLKFVLKQNFITEAEYKKAVEVLNAYKIMD